VVSASTAFKRYASVSQEGRAGKDNP
jgi:hypothetical protein